MVGGSLRVLWVLPPLKLGIFVVLILFVVYDFISDTGCQQENKISFD
jgi:hypothetical protein